MSHEREYISCQLVTGIVVTHLTERVKSTGLDLLFRTRKDPSSPRSRSIFSASSPETLGWNHRPMLIRNSMRKRNRCSH